MASSYTIDDFYGDQGTGLGAMPVYSPASSSTGPNQWDIEGGTCTGCSAQGAGFKVPIDPSQVHSGTWKSTTMDVNEPLTTLSVQFRGSSITMYCLLPPDLGPYITSAMNLTFVLDGEQVGVYDRPAGTGDTWTYQGQVFKSDWLDGHLHTLVVTLNAPTSYPPYNGSFIAFDNFLVGVNESPPIPSDNTTTSSSTSSTSSSSSGSSPLPARTTTQLPVSSSNSESPSQQSSTSSPSHKNLAGPIAGAVVGAVIFIILLCALICCLRRRRHRQTSLQGGRWDSTPPATPLFVPPGEVTTRPMKTKDTLHPSVPWESMYAVDSGSSNPATEPQQSVTVPSSTSQPHADTRIPSVQSQNIQREILELRAELDRVRALREIEEPPPVYEAS